MAKLFGLLGKIVLATVFSQSVLAQEIRVGANVGNVPWEFRNESGKLVGFEIDLVNDISDRIGRPVRFENVPFNGLFAAVQAGRVDMAISFITITPKRLETVAFAQPYYDSDQAMVVTSTSPLSGVADLSGAVVGTETGSTGDGWVTSNKDKLGIRDIRRYEGTAPAMLDLASGRIDAYIFDVPNVQYFIKDKPQYRIAARIPTHEQFSIMFAKGDDELRLKINAAIADLKRDGTLSRIYKTWFGVDPGASSSTVRELPLPETAH